MITYIKGKLTHAAPHYVVMETGGIGYKIAIPTSVFAKLPAVGSDTILHTLLVVRELSQSLYGFLSETERDLFLELTGISGIGPKIALNLIGHLPVEQLHVAVCNADIGAISKVPGIGKKTAERIVIEMRDKLGKSAKNHGPSDFSIHLEKDSHAQKVMDAMNALINLGYNQSTAQSAIKSSLKKLPESIDLSALITEALKHV